MLHCFLLKVHVDTLDSGPSPVRDSTESETCLFLVVIIIIIKMGHGTWDTLKDYLTVMNSSLHHFSTKQLYVTGS